MDGNILLAERTHTIRFAYSRSVRMLYVCGVRVRQEQAVILGA